MKKILVTGSSGAIASRFCRKLERENIQVIPFDLAEGDDLMDYLELFKKVARADSVWHFAAMADLNYAAADPLKCMEVNIKGTYYLTHICHELKVKLNFISTCCVYGNCGEFPSSEKNLPNPSELYAHSKLAGENIVLGYHKQVGLKYNILRIPTTYGEGMRPALAIAQFIKRAKANEDIIIHGNGEQTRTYTYIKDLIDALWLIESKGIENETFNISSDEEISVNNLVELIKTMTESNSKIIWGYDRIGQTYREFIDTTKLKKLGWEAKVSLVEGLKKCL